MRTSPGKPEPLGTSKYGNGINFAIHARDIKTITLIIHPESRGDDMIEIPLDPQKNRAENIWHIMIEDLPKSFSYNYKLRQNLADPPLIVNDPYARILQGRNLWAAPRNSLPIYRCLHTESTFNWEEDVSPSILPADTIIYELHVRGFTQDQSSGVKARGTFLGLTEKIPYLKSLGITTVELLPICEFDETIVDRKNPLNGKQLFNYWGYDPLGYFAPKTSYAWNSDRDGPIIEFKTMVKEFHRAGLEVILDVVYNHTGEGPQDGPTYSFRALDETGYYMVDKTGYYQNFTGCGNTFNCNHPLVQNLIIDSLRYWVMEMHVDGFRFDLASILSRGKNGPAMKNPPLLTKINSDPILSKTKLIAEAWDAAGLYQVGAFPGGKRWAEWNDKFRDTIRRHVRSDEGVIPELATRISGSSDLFRPGGRSPNHSINFITAHDGFTLNDLVSFNQKRNKMNGEDNRDGANENFSSNYGKEGPSTDSRINKLRLKQMKNMFCLLLLSQGTPMIVAGDEFGRTQQGNNNPYCQDNEISWVDWEQLEKNADLFRFFKFLIEFRKEHPSLRREHFFDEESAQDSEIIWYNSDLKSPQWSGRLFSLAFHLAGNKKDSDIYVISNSAKETKYFKLPKLVRELSWTLSIDTSKASPEDIVSIGEELQIEEQEKYNVVAQSTVVLVAKKF